MGPKKKQKKGEPDFKKTKLKVGHTHKTAAQAKETKVNIQSKAIIVPLQSFAEDTGDVKSSRNLSLKDLLSQMKHYSAGTRKDAVLGTLEIFQKSRDHALAHISSIFDRVTPLIVDDNEDVRAATRSFLLAFTHDLSRADLAPFKHVLFAYTSSALSHILEDIRVDAVKFVTAFLQHPAQWIAEFSDKLLLDCTGLIMSSESMSSGDSKSTSSMLAVNPRSVLGSTQFRLDLLTTILALLRLSSRVDTAPGPHTHTNTHTHDARVPELVWTDAAATELTIYSGLSYDSSSRLSEHVPLIDLSPPSAVASRSVSVTSTRLTVTVPGQTRGASASTSAASSLHANHVATPHRTLIDRLQPLLTSLWVEIAPSVFLGSARTPQQLTLSSALISCILDILALLWRSYSDQTQSQSRDAATTTAAETAWVADKFASLNKTVAVHFPYATSHPPNVSPADVLEWDAAFSEYATCITPRLRWDTAEPNVAAAAKKLSVRVAEAMVDIIKAGWTKEGFPRVERAVRSVVRFGDEELREKIVNAVIEAHSKLKTQDVRRGTSALLMGMVMGTERLQLDEETSVVRDGLKTWVLTLPKTLWELKATDPELSERILLTLNTVHRERIYEDLSQDAGEFLTAIQNSFVPVFSVELPSGGTAFGPFLELPRGLQTLCLSMVYYLSHTSDKMLKALAACLTSSDITASILQHAFDVLGCLHSEGLLPLTDYLSILWTMLIGYRAKELDALQSGRKPEERFMSLSSGIAAKKRDTAKKRKHAADAPRSDEDTLTFWSKQRLRQKIAVQQFISLGYMDISSFLSISIELINRFQVQKSS
ncbi:hypothetical protein M427DRAFT_39245 [Gonapodya prolifera JEL478]|uniref:Pre-rRNA-processing protein n=1 Tax=Gonapodya prolifera (strain JEL478) TaxID=1344416 RepID=A0A138ZXM2_GONPJ|nr:hypothetical protein M427DRAFT_39245 [Gonapodya prolifera JEL478]|eukprot:KXS09248.1 hypothetical protein M427DRAFT_39245 [Gonapodya prolifera JEL478]